MTQQISDKEISDLYAEILMDLIQDRLELLEPKIERYKRRPATQDLFTEFED